jgi:FkbH-like protein
LKSDDFVATAINWEPKPDNIRRLAADLGLGLDSFVFLDDSPQEREAMRRICPSVRVPEMPADPARRPLWLRSLACTWPLRLTDEDARRSEMYVAERKGREFKESVHDYEQYLAGLQQKLIIEPVTSRTLARAAQLHQRTNQFNLTNRRLSESEINAFMTDERRGLGLVGQVCDRFGDLGIVLAACLSLDEATARIESFVMSCRVIGRQIEAAFLETLKAHLAGKGVKRIVGSYCPTAKNAIVRDLYPSMGFASAGQEDGAELWELHVDMKMSSTVSTRPVIVEWGKS